MSGNTAGIFQKLFDDIVTCRVASFFIVFDSFPVMIVHMITICDPTILILMRSRLAPNIHNVKGVKGERWLTITKNKQQNVIINASFDIFLDII